MDTINEIKRQELPEEQEIDLIELAQKLWKERKFLLKGCGIAVVVGLIVAFSIPKEYTTTVKLAPETQDAAKKSSLGGLAAMECRCRCGRDLSGFVSGCGAEYPVSVGIVSGRGYR